MSDPFNATAPHEQLCCRLATLWEREREKMRPVASREFVDVLDEIDHITRGNPRRCYCATGKDTDGREHDMRCPANPLHSRR